MKHAHAPCTYGHHGYLFEFRKYKKHSHYRDTPNLKDEGRQHRLMHTNRVLWLRGTCGRSLSAEVTSWSHLLQFLSKQFPGGSAGEGSGIVTVVVGVPSPTQELPQTVAQPKRKKPLDQNQTGFGRKYFFTKRNI